MSSMDAIRMLETGIAATGAREGAIANNIANFQTPGYRRLDVDFSKLLSDAMRSIGHAGPPSLYQPKTTPTDERGNDVQLETEVGEMIKNDMARKTYLRMLSKVYVQMQIAMKTEG